MNLDSFTNKLAVSIVDFLTYAKTKLHVSVKNERITYINKMILALAYPFAMALIKENTNADGTIKELNKQDIENYVVSFFRSLYNNIPFDKLNEDIISKEELVSKIKESISEFTINVLKWYTNSNALLTSNNKATDMYNFLKNVPSPIYSESANVSPEYKRYLESGKQTQPVIGIEE